MTRRKRSLSTALFFPASRSRVKYLGGSVTITLNNYAWTSEYLQEETGRSSKNVDFFVNVYKVEDVNEGG